MKAETGMGDLAYETAEATSVRINSDFGDQRQNCRSRVKNPIHRSLHGKDRTRLPGLGRS
jgi:hypothetical protein